MHVQSYILNAELGKLSAYDVHSTSRLSNLAGDFADKAACRAQLAQGDPALYRIYGTARPEVAGDLSSGLTVLYPGQVGGEYYMTKGHFHAILDRAEVYYALSIYPEILCGFLSCRCSPNSHNRFSG